MAEQPLMIGMANEQISRHQVAIDVSAAIARASDAVRQHDVYGMAAALACAVELYEEYPTHVHQPSSHLGDVLACIRVGRRLCVALGRAESQLAALENRAEALQRPLH